MLTFCLPWLPALWCLHADGRAKADTQSACALTYNGCLQLHKSTVGLQSTQTGYTENSHPPTTAQALKSTKINLKEKEALQGRDLVRQSIITSHLMSPNSKCVFQSYERKGSQQTKQHRGKLGTFENNQKVPSWLYGVLDQHRSSHETYSHRAAAIIKQNLEVMDMKTGWKSFLCWNKWLFQNHLCS